MNFLLRNEHDPDRVWQGQRSNTQEAPLTTMSTQSATAAPQVQVQAQGSGQSAAAAAVFSSYAEGASAGDASRALPQSGVGRIKSLQARFSGEPEATAAPKPGAGAQQATAGQLIRNWWVKDRQNLDKLLSRTRDSGEMSYSELDAVVRFLEQDDKGKRELGKIRALKQELAEKAKASEPASASRAHAPAPTSAPVEDVAVEGSSKAQSTPEPSPSVATTAPALHTTPEPTPSIATEPPPALHTTPEPAPSVATEPPPELDITPEPAPSVAMELSPESENASATSASAAMEQAPKPQTTPPHASTVAMAEAGASAETVTRSQMQRRVWPPLAEKKDSSPALVREQTPRVLRPAPVTPERKQAPPEQKQASQSAEASRAEPEASTATAAPVPRADPAPMAKSKAYWYADFQGSLFGKGQRPQPDHVKQGQLGDCWLMAALDSLSRHEEGSKLLQGMIQDLGGAYKVTFPGSMRAGEKLPAEEVVVTKQLLSVGGKSLVNALRGREKIDDLALWPAMIEKAAALSQNARKTIEGRNQQKQSAVGYELLVGGDTTQGFSVLTGKPTRVATFLSNPAKAKQDVLAMHAKGPVVVAQKIGQFHAWSVVDATSEFVIVRDPNANLKDATSFSEGFATEGQTLRKLTWEQFGQQFSEAGNVTLG